MNNPTCEIRPPYLGKTTAATREALPIHTSMNSIFSCPNNGIAASCLGLIRYYLPGVRSVSNAQAFQNNSGGHLQFMEKRNQEELDKLYIKCK